MEMNQQQIIALDEEHHIFSIYHGNKSTIRSSIEAESSILKQFGNLNRKIGNLLLRHLRQNIENDRIPINFSGRDNSSRDLDVFLGHLIKSTHLDQNGLWRRY